VTSSVQMTTVKAKSYAARGWSCVPVQFQSKAPVLEGWQNLRLGESDIQDYFDGQPQNIGVLLGDPSNGLVDIDLDSPETVQLAALVLPQTPCRFGRAGSRGSHWLYDTGPAEPTAQYKDVDGSMLVEFRSTGAQTVFPGSIHPSGEAIEWEEFEDPLAIGGPILKTKVAILAAAALIARHWPAEGSRQNAALALAGGLLRAGWGQGDVESFIDAVGLGAGDEEVGMRVGAAGATEKRIRDDQRVTGWPALAELVGTKVVDLAGQWLNVPAGSNRSVNYQATEHGLVWLKPTKDGCVTVPLTNFTATVAAQLVEDDGVEVHRLLEIATNLNGHASRFSIPAAQFAGMNWAIEHLGARAIVYPGFGTKEHARAAIQVLSTDIVDRSVYTHLGWREIDGVWVYLHAEGAIGSDGPVPDLEVAVPETLSRFVLPSPPDGADLVTAIRASLGMLEVAADDIIFPIYGAVWRAVLGSTDFSVFAVGETGVGKSEIAALAQQHFGAGLDARHLPGSWSSTANALEGLAFAAKDVLLVVDDFAPTGSTSDVQKMHRDADRVLRAQGNTSGRGRMRSDATLKPTKPPRGLILCTGEDIPNGQSLRARIFVSEVRKTGPGAVDLTKLSICQRDAASGLYAQAMAGFIRWLAPRYQDIRRDLNGQQVNLRNKADSTGLYLRTADIVASLTVGILWFLKFAQDVEAISKDKAQDWTRRALDSLDEKAESQSEHQADSDPAQRFLELLASGLTRGSAHLTDTKGMKPIDGESWGWRADEMSGGGPGETRWTPKGSRIGWIDGEDVYLESQAAYAEVQKMTREGGNSLTVSLPTLKRRLKEKGLLASTEKTAKRERLEVRRVIQGQRRQVLHLKASSLIV